MSKFKYNPGDLLGPKNILFIERTNKIGNNWEGIFQCPDCYNNFVARLGNIVSGHTLSCGCTSYQRVGEKQRKDLTGQIFGRLKVIKLADRNQYLQNRTTWICECECGTKNFYVTSHNLLLGYTKSCGCLKKEIQKNFYHNSFKDLTNQKFGQLLVIEKTNDRTKNGKVIWKCLCDCGNTAFVATDKLTTRHTQSCGCLNSRGEQKVSNILNSLNIVFQQQYVYNNCRNPKTNAPLRFDFYLPDYNCCIEYDGEQHFKEKENYYRDTLNERQKRDNIKTQYCKDNNIKLVRIPYWDYDRIDKEYTLGKLK